MVTNKWLQLAIYFEFGIFFNIEFRLSMYGGQNCWGISTLFCDFFSSFKDYSTGARGRQKPADSVGTHKPL